MRKAEEEQGARRLTALFGRISGGKAPERNQTGFGRFEFQVELTEPLAPHALKALGVPRMFEAHEDALATVMRYSPCNEVGGKDHAMVGGPDAILGPARGRIRLALSHGRW